jgi:hypothetical protein
MTTGVTIELPEGFVVLDVVAPAQVEVAGLPEQLAEWYARVVAARTAAGAELLALQVEPAPDDPEQLTALSLAVHLLPLAPAPVEVVVQGLRALALARTTTSGQVSVLGLPTGPAVGAADVVLHAGVPAAAATLQLPLPQIGRLLTLTLCTPAADRLAACAAVAAAVSARVRLDLPERTA